MHPLLRPPGEPSVALGQKMKHRVRSRRRFLSHQAISVANAPVFEKNPELKEVYKNGIQLVLEAGNTQLMKKGLQPVEHSPDVFITFFLHANPGQSIKIVDAGYGWYGPATWTTTEIDSYMDGMLVIDIVDASTSKLIWRAYCGDHIREMKKRDKKITAAVKKALDRFPPKEK